MTNGIALAASLALVPFAAAAHGDAAWIAAGEYRAASGALCCGVSDCNRVKVISVTPDAIGRYLVVYIWENTTRSELLVTDGPKHLGLYFDSPDGASWGCLYGSPPTLKCLWLAPQV